MNITIIAVFVLYAYISFSYVFGTCILRTNREVCETQFPFIIGLMWIVTPVWLPFHTIGRIIIWLSQVEAT